MINLVGKDGKGKLRQVQIDNYWSDDQHGFVIQRYTGCVGGKITTQPTILVDKGKAKRTVTEQNKLQLDHLIKEYLDKGYKQLDNDISEYSETELLEIVGENATNQDGVLKPMLAKQQDKVTNRKIFDKEWYISRKIDGVRCLMYWDGSKVRTASRGGNNYDPSTTFLREHPDTVKFFQSHPTIILDGEIYCHGRSLQNLSGLARLEKDTSGMDILQYYIYDIVDVNKTFEERLKILNEIKEELNLSFDPNREFKNELKFQMVPHDKVSGWDNMMKFHDDFIGEGFEGAVIRDPKKVYKPNGRTNDMLKIKIFTEGEYLITGISEGLREEDMCFTLQDSEGRSFKAKPVGTRELKQQYRDNLDSIIGKMGTVKYFYLSDDGTPTLPVFKCVRDYE